MSALNKILNIVILLLAIAALACGLALFTKRQQLRDHSDKLAQTMEKVVATIAPDTPLANEAKYNDGQGNLGFNNVDGLDALGNKITAQATGLVKQRNDLGTAVADLATGLNLDAEAKPEQFTAMDGYGEQLEAVKGKVDAVNKRNTDIIAKVAEIGGSVNVPVEVSDLNNTETYAEPLDKVSDAVSSLKERSDTSVAVLKKVVETLGTDTLGVETSDFSDPDKFDAAVGKLEGGVQEISKQVKSISQIIEDRDKLNTELTKTTQQLNIERENVANLKVTQENTESNLTTMTEEMQKFKKLYEDLKEQGNDTHNVFYGKIIDVNYDWQYAIIDLGKKKNLPQNLTMTIGRDREFIANAQVTKVFADYAVVDILPDKKQGEVLVGDSVFYMGAGAAGDLQ